MLHFLQPTVQKAHNPYFRNLNFNVVTMAEAAAASAAPAPVTDDASKEKRNDKGKQRRKKEDDVPIEELYDLSKPIPRVSFEILSEK